MNFERIIMMIFRMFLRRGVNTVIRRGVGALGRKPNGRPTHGTGPTPDAPRGPWNDAQERKLRERQRSINRISRF